MRRAELAIASLFLSGAAAAAEEVRYYAGVDFVSNYVASGVTQSMGRPAVQPYFEVGKDGYYFGTWMSNVEFGNGDHAEIDLYAGYRKIFAEKLFVDLSYARYMYDSSGECCGELRATVAFPLYESLAFKGYVAVNPDEGEITRRATLAYEFTPKLGAAATYGRSDAAANDFWLVGMSYAVNENWSFDLAYQGSDRGDEGLVLRLSLASNQSSLARLLIAPFAR